MSVQPFDKKQYKANERQAWDSAAVGWKMWNFNLRMLKDSTCRPPHLARLLPYGLANGVLEQAMRETGLRADQASDQPGYFVCFWRSHLAMSTSSNPKDKIGGFSIGHLQFS